MSDNGSLTGNCAIRPLLENDLSAVMEIWLNTNIKAHSFIPKEYWTNHFPSVKEMLPQAEVYVYEDPKAHQAVGFIGLTGDYIAGVFVKEGVRSKGIGKQLLDYVKAIKSDLSLSVYQKNERAIAFYQREQFVIHAEDIDKATGEKEFVMIWRQQEKQKTD